METAQISCVVCMQCGTVIRTFPVPEGNVSHGLCHDCARELQRRLQLVPEEQVVVGQGV
jgi:hypothetical protein